MIFRYLIFLLIFQPVLVTASPLLPAYSTGYDATRDPFADGRDALALAKQSNRRVLIEIGGNWCSWCHKLDAFIENNPEVHTELYRHFVVLKINVSEENDNQAFLDGLPKIQGYPHIFVADANGNILYSKDTAELLHDRQYSPQRFLAFIKEWKQP